MMQDITALLQRSSEGDKQAFDLAVALLYQDLRRLARKTGGQNWFDTLGTTVLINEAYLKLSRSAESSWTNRGHFLAVAARAIRQVVVDYARSKIASKRTGIEVRNAEYRLQSATATPELVVAIDYAMESLMRENEVAALVFECKYYAGYSTIETSKALDMPVRTVERHWTEARHSLKEILERDLR